MQTIWTRAALTGILPKRFAGLTRHLVCQGGAAWPVNHKAQSASPKFSVFNVRSGFLCESVPCLWVLFAGHFFAFECFQGATLLLLKSLFIAISISRLLPVSCLIQSAPRFSLIGTLGRLLHRSIHSRFLGLCSSLPGSAVPVASMFPVSVIIRSLQVHNLEPGCLEI